MKAFWTALLLAGPALAQPGSRAPLLDNPVVEIKGVIRKVQITPGAGMPSLEVEQKGTVHRVVLGSLRYLMQENFNPKAGAQVVVKGYRVGENVIAASVTLPADRKTLRLRDDNGWPVWGGRWRGPAMQH